MKRDSTVQTLVVATMLCVVCSVIVAGAAVGLRPRQQANKRLDKKKNVLIAAGLIQEGQVASQQVIDEKFTENILYYAIDIILKKIDVLYNKFNYPYYNCDRCNYFISKNI